MAQSIELTPRVVPAQKRAEITVQHILDVAASLLDEVVIVSFNTNLIAERANVRVATIYRYFPNKLAILNALIERWLVLAARSMAFTRELADPHADWREIVARVVDTYAEIVLSQKGHLAIRRAVQAVPELARTEARMVRKIADTIVTALAQRGLPHAPDKIRTFTEIFLATTAQAVDMAAIKNKKHEHALEEIIAETKLLQISYLANYLDKQQG